MVGAGVGRRSGGAGRPRRRGRATAPPSPTCGRWPRLAADLAAARPGPARRWSAGDGGGRGPLAPGRAGRRLWSRSTALVAAMPPVGRAEQTAPPSRPVPARRRARSSPTRSTPWSTPRSATGSPAPSHRWPAPRGEGRGRRVAGRVCTGARPRRLQLPRRELGVAADAVAQWDEVGDTEPSSTAGRASGWPRSARCVRSIPSRPDDQTGDGTHWQLQFLLRSDGRPEPAGAGRADLVRRGRPAARRPAGAVARRAGPGRAWSNRGWRRALRTARPEVTT